MDTGERFTLIRSIYATFQSSYEWDGNLIDAALWEFGAEWVDDQDPEYRALERLRTMQDGQLEALNRYVHPQEADPATLETERSDEGPWRPDTFRLFISHTSEHQALAGAVRESLAQWQIDCFVAHTTIEPTDEWVDVIESALRTCDALTALVTADFIGSRWCDQEVGVAYGLGTLIVPVKIGANPYGFIGRYQALTHNPDRENHWSLGNRLFELLAGHAKSSQRMIDPVINRFSESRSFDGTRAAWPAIKAFPREAWTDERVGRVRQACRDNSQVWDGSINGGGEWFKAPELVERHFEHLGIEAEQPAGAEDDEIPF